MTQQDIQIKDDQRLVLLENWLAAIENYEFTGITPASSDASFRRYFRTTDLSTGSTYIVMDAPPDKENCQPFIDVTNLLIDAGINAPHILYEDQAQGFLLLSDLGNDVYLGHLQDTAADTLYKDAIQTLVNMQQIDNNLPAYSKEKLRAEMELFEPWYLNKHLNVTLSLSDQSELNAMFDLLINNAIEQPQVFVHRDFHSRNLMVTDNNNPGVIDYQDAVTGPITYDLVSLLKDCYIEWPEYKRDAWINLYLDESRKINRQSFDLNTFRRWFDLMGVQRHLKVLGIFCRLNYRDNKPQYLNDLPLTLKYVIETCRYYDDLSPLRRLFEQHVINHPLVSEE